MELGNLDFKSLGTAPQPVKAGIIGGLCVIILALGYFLHIKDQRMAFAQAAQEEEGLRKTFEEKQNKAVNLEAYKQQMKEMEESFATMLRQLPSKTEVADLLEDITQTGLATGLTFDLFKPEAETPREFYAELPITLELSGTYHQFGAFVSGVAALPRIVTIHDVSVGGADKKAGSGFKMKATARTYRYMDPAEIAAAAAAKAAADKKNPKNKKKGK
jgi:type IV pilus assembly protein PilO